MTINKWVFFWGLAVYFVLSSIAFLSLPTEDFGLSLFVLGVFIPFSGITLLSALIINNINWGILGYLIISGIMFLSPFIGYGFSFHFFIPFSIVSLIVFLITKSIYKDSQNNIRPHISLVLLWFLILFQILSVLFFYSTCSSFSDPKLEGGYFMYEELLLDNKDQKYCGVDVSERLSKKTFILTNILIFTYPGYILLLPLFIIRAYYLAFKNRNKDELYNKISVIKILIGIISLIAIISLILYAVIV
jgi:hypothetical protein